MPTASAPTDDGLAWPRDFEGRRAAGLELGVALGGGGLFLLAWHVAYLHTLAEDGIDLHRAPRLVGTSAGSVMATGLAAGRLGVLNATISVLDRAPGFIAHLAPAGDLRPSQVRAVDAFWGMAEADPATIREVGHAALAAHTPSAGTMARNIGAFLGVRRWPAPNLHVTCMDTFSGERCVVTAGAKVSPARAVAASSAIPGVFAPQPIGDRKCMDGGVSWSGVHLDVVAGADRVIVLALPPDLRADDPNAGRAADTEAELDELRATGSKVFARYPEHADAARLMDPSAVAEAFEMGRRQARADRADLRAFLA